ncbi:terminase TerL endonuclease subunit [Sphingosinicella sp. BN140058]|uniref:terminase TerL endonuclease subunit n=1 Tax=Sphingosinicella sp. BN140058 TaxID=1892855 RepID=UPI0010103944|nr:terminase TerL endonuclease subunit [Sphingosinicella sp. BN140058]QAY77914.1 terminase large subunit [Sphingosinicella sp. BN140058]
MALRPEWNTALPDWEERLLAGQSLVPDLPLFESEAARALRIFKRLRIPDVHGTPTMQVACGPWYFPIVGAVFGCYDPETHMRMLQEFFLLIPKGNSKSSYGGPLMLTAVIMNRRPEAGFSIIAPTIKVAEIAFNQAEGTIRLDPELDKLFHIQRHVRTITHRTTGAALKIKAADTDVVTGGKDVGTMIDETHVFAKKSDAAAIFVELRGALRKRKDGFLFQTTTQSKAPPSGQFKRELDRARAVRNGELKRPVLPVLYEYPESVLEGEKWKSDRKLWHLVNPNMGRSLDEQGLSQALEDAEKEGIDQLLLIASQHFNIQIGMGLHGDRWRGADHWEKAGAPEICGSLETMLARCEVAVVGIDGGGLDDLLGLCVAGRERETKRWLYWFHAWVWRDVLDLRKEIAPQLLDFEEAGDLTILDFRQGDDGVWELDDGDGEEREEVGADEDIRQVVAIIETVKASGLLPEKNAVGLDPQGVGALVDALSGIGLEHPQVMAIGQGFRLSSAVWSMERKLKHRMLAHSGSAMMAWCVSNAKAEQRGNAVLITKETAGKAKIDPLVAGFNATKLLEANPEAVVKPDIDSWIAGLRAA